MRNINNHFFYKNILLTIFGILFIGIMILFFGAEKSSAQTTLTLDAEELFNNTGAGPNPSPDNNNILYQDVDGLGIADVRLRKLEGNCMNACDAGGCPGNCGSSSDMWGAPSPGAPHALEEGVWMGCMNCPAPGAIGNAVRQEIYQIDIYETGTNNLLEVDNVLLRFNSLNNNTEGFEEISNFQIFDNTGFNVTGSTNLFHTSIQTIPPVVGCGGGTKYEHVPNRELTGISASACNDGAFMEFNVTNSTLSSIRYRRADSNCIIGISGSFCTNDSDGSYLGLIEFRVDEILPTPTPVPTPTLPPGVTPGPTPAPGPASVPALDILGLVGFGVALLLAAIFMLHRRRANNIK